MNFFFSYWKNEKSTMLSVLNSCVFCMQIYFWFSQIVTNEIREIEIHASQNGVSDAVEQPINAEKCLSFADACPIKLKRSPFCNAFWA